MLPAFRRDGSLNVIVESPRGSSVKFKYDPDDEVIMVSRPLPAGLVYPYDWGFIPSTRAADGDPLDVLIAWDEASYPGIVIPSRVIGVLKVEQTNLETKRRERNDRVIGLPRKAPRVEHITSVFNLADRVRAEIERFFLNAVAFEGKELQLVGWGGPDEADGLVQQAAAAVTRSPGTTVPVTETS
jgi:inorganic pyrophosphatase